MPDGLADSDLRTSASVMGKIKLLKPVGHLSKAFQIGFFQVFS